MNEIRETIGREHPDLRVVVDGGAVLVRGTYRLENGGEILDQFQIEIEFPDDYDESLPRVRETGGRIPRTVDRHVIPRTGYACLLVEEDWLVAVGRNYTFKQFLDGPVRNYFLGQSLVDAGRPWPHGERSHGVAGLEEVLFDWFGTHDKNAILRYLLCFTKRRIKGHWPCPCGSGKPIRNCHVAEIRELQQRLTPPIAIRYVSRLMAAIEAETKAQRLRANE